MKEIKLNDDQLQELIAGIMALAAEDFRKAYIEHITSGRVLTETTKFFGSKWAQFLAGGVDTKYILERLESEAEEKAAESEDYLQLVKALKKQRTKNTASRIRVFSENGVFYILNLNEGNKAAAQRRAFELLESIYDEGN